MHTNGICNSTKAYAIRRAKISEIIELGLWNPKSSKVMPILLVKTRKTNIPLNSLIAIVIIKSSILTDELASIIKGYIKNVIPTTTIKKIKTYTITEIILTV